MNRWVVVNETRNVEMQINIDSRFCSLVYIEIDIVFVLLVLLPKPLPVSNDAFEHYKVDSTKTSSKTNKMGVIWKDPHHRPSTTGVNSLIYPIAFQNPPFGFNLEYRKSSLDSIANEDLTPALCSSSLPTCLVQLPAVIHASWRIR